MPKTLSTAATVLKEGAGICNFSNQVSKPPLLFSLGPLV